MEKLNQIVAVEKGVRARTQKTITDLHHLTKKPLLFNGFVRQYEPVNAEGEHLDEERTKVQFDISSVLQSMRHAFTEQMDIVASKDYGNVQPTARASVEIDGVVLVKDAPVPFLLYLEKELVDIQTFINALPELDIATDWTKNEQLGLWASREARTVRTQKVQDKLVLLEPTTEHPGKAEIITRDVTVGHWRTTKYSGAIPLRAKTDLVAKIHRLIDAVKKARETANNADVARINVGDNILGWLLG